MKKFYFIKASLLSCCLFFAAAANAATPTTPDVEGYFGYSGDSFIAYWGLSEDASAYLLNVFSLTDESVEKSVEFTSLTAPANWTVTASEMHHYTDGKDYILLKNDGDGVLFYNPDGVIDYFDISGLSIGFNGDDVTDQNSCSLRFELFDNSGQRIGYTVTSGYAFSLLPTISLETAWGERLPENLCGVRISVVRSEQQVKGEIALTSASFSHKKRSFVTENFETADNMELVENLDPEGIYYYYVVAKNDDGLSKPSDIVKVDGFLPTSATYHTDVTPTSYTARWEPVAKAEVYYINHYQMVSVEGENGRLNVIKETFSGSTQGSIDEPVSVESLDGLCDNEGWSGYTLIAAPGMVGAGSGRRGSAVIYTPRFDASADGGTYQVHIRAKGNPGEKLNIIRQNKYEWIDGVPTAIMQTVVFGEDGWVDEVLTMTDGDDNTYMSLEETAGGMAQNPFLIDEFTVSVSSENGGFTQKYLTRRYTEGKENTSYTFTGLEPGGTYAFEVIPAKLDTRGDEMMAEKSELHIVELDQEASVTLPGEDGSVAWQDGKLVSTLNSPVDAKVYDLSGRQVKTVLIPAGSAVTDFGLPNGVYVVRASKYAFKIAVR